MNVEAHLACGWALAHAAGVESRRFRGLVTLAAIAPDIDTISYLWGIDAYANYHHAFGHNVFFGLLVSGMSMWLLPRRAWKVLLFTQLAFASHYFGDYFFTRFPIKAYWPLYSHAYIYSYRIGLDHPINLFFSYFSMLIIIFIAIPFKRTPVEFISPELDRRLVNLFSNRPLCCSICHRRANEKCITCGQPVCMRHGQLNGKFQVVCRNCAKAGQVIES